MHHLRCFGKSPQDAAYGHTAISTQCFSAHAESNNDWSDDCDGTGNIISRRAAWVEMSTHLPYRRTLPSMMPGISLN